MRRAVSLITILILIVAGGVMTQMALTGDFGFRLFGFRDYPLPELGSLNLGPFFAAISSLPGLGWVGSALPDSIPAAPLLVGLVLILLGGTIATGIAMAVWTSRTTFEMVKERKLPPPSNPTYRGEKVAPYRPISDRLAVTLVIVALILGGLWATQKSGSPLPALGTVTIPLPRLSGSTLELSPTQFRADVLFGGLAAALILGTVAVGLALAFWFRRTAEEMQKEGVKSSPVAAAPAGEGDEGGESPAPRPATRPARPAAQRSQPAAPKPAPAPAKPTAATAEPGTEPEASSPEAAPPVDKQDAPAAATQEN